MILESRCHLELAPYRSLFEWSWESLRVTRGWHRERERATVEVCCCVYLPTDGCHVPGGRDKGRGFWQELMQQGVAVCRWVQVAGGRQGQDRGTQTRRGRRGTTRVDEAPRINIRVAIPLILPSDALWWPVADLVQNALGTMDSLCFKVAGFYNWAFKDLFNAFIKEWHQFTWLENHIFSVPILTLVNPMEFSHICLFDPNCG